MTTKKWLDSDVAVAATTDVARDQFEAGRGNASRTLMRPLGTRARIALPRLSDAAGGAVLWAALIAVSAAFALYDDGWAATANAYAIVWLFALGAGIAFPLASFTARFVAFGRPRSVAFAAFFLALSAGTMIITAGLFALQYRLYYAEWHADAFTVPWAFQLVFTTAAAVYQFAVLGVRLYFPFGFVLLFAISAWFALRLR